MPSKVDFNTYLERFYPTEVVLASMSNDVLEQHGPDLSQHTFGTMMRERIVEWGLEAYQESRGEPRRIAPRWLMWSLIRRSRVDFP